jgi:hypothetical protein
MTWHGQRTSNGNDWGIRAPTGHKISRLASARIDENSLGLKLACQVAGRGANLFRHPVSFCR